MSLKPSPTFLKAMSLMLVLSLAPLTIYILYTRTGGPESQKERAFQKNLRYGFMGNDTAIDLAPMTDWGWSRVCAIDSGVSASEMEAVIGFKYKDYDQLHWMPVPKYWTLMFIDTERETNWGMHYPVTPIRIPRQDLGDLVLPEGQKGACVPRDTGRLFIQRGKAPVGVSPITASLKELTSAAEAPNSPAN